MLRCVIARRFLKNRQALCQELLSFRQSLAGKLYQTRSLSFLPIVSSHDTAKEGLSQKDELDQSRIVHTPVDVCVTSPEISKPSDNAITERAHGKDDANSHGGPPTQHGYFSASLADGTIVHNLLPGMTLSRFEQVAIETSEIWKQCSHEILSHVSAQSVGIAVRGLRDDDSTISARIYDINTSRGPRTVHYYKWSISTNNTHTTISERRDLKNVWNQTRKTLVRALENHVGSVDRDGSLVMLSRPSPHALHSAFKDIDRIFAYDVPATTHHPMSVVLDDRTFVSPIPEASIESDIFLSLATISWQWWQQEQGLRSEAQSGITNVRIIETDPTEKSLRVEVWRMSQTANKSLIRSVCKLFFSDINGSFVSSCVESRDEVTGFMPGSDTHLRNHAVRFLRNNIGWIDSAGRLIEGGYPEIQQLIKGFRRRRLPKTSPASESQPILTPKTSTTRHEPQAVNESARINPNNKSAEAGVVNSSSHGEESANIDTGKAFPEDDSRPSASKKDEFKIMSASLHDGTPVVPAITHCQRKSSSVGLGFRDILSIISQWREQTRQDNDQGQFDMPPLIYVRTYVDPRYIEIDILRRGGGRVEHSSDRHKLYYTPQASGCSFIKAESIQARIRTERGRRRRAKAMTDVFRHGLRNHVGTVNENGVLRTSKQPTIHEALYDLGQHIRWPEPAPNVTSNIETTHAQTRYTPLEPTDNGKPEKKPEQISRVVQGISMHDQIASTMKLAGALFEISIMLNEGMSNAPSQKHDSTSSDHIDSSLLNEPNPVFRTMKNGEIDIDTVQDVMAEFRTRLGDHQDKAQILARVCRRWKQELEIRYPMMKRKSATHNDLDDLLSSRSKSSKVTNCAPKRVIISESDKQDAPSRVRFVGSSSKLKPASTLANHKGDEKTLAEPRTTDKRSESTSTTKLGNSKEEGHPAKQQEKFSSNRDAKRPYSRSSSGRDNGHSKKDGDFSIFSW